tara:strand:- start:531 stop:638 length:108 start_codon:yes stop_codon:yes gene_type:complete
MDPLSSQIPSGDAPKIGKSGCGINPNSLITVPVID